MTRTTVKHLLDAGILSPGEWLHTRAFGRDWRARVLEDGRLRVHNRRFDSPSAAVRFIKEESGAENLAGGNGWVWFRTASGATLAELRDGLHGRGQAAA